LFKNHRDDMRSLRDGLETGENHQRTVLIFLALLLAGIAAGAAWLYVTGGNVP
jgi:hypothetical protein